MVFRPERTILFAIWTAKGPTCGEVYKGLRVEGDFRRSEDLSETVKVKCSGSSTKVFAE